MTSSATRRKLRRQDTKSRLQQKREEAGDETFGISLRPLKSAEWFARVRWYVDRDPFQALIALSRLRQTLSGVEHELVHGCREAALSWDDIGFALGVTGEAVRKRYVDTERHLEATA